MEACDGGSDWGSIGLHIDGFACVRAAMQCRRMKSLQNSSRYTRRRATIFTSYFNQQGRFVDRQTFKHRRLAALAGWQPFAGRALPSQPRLSPGDLSILHS
jgi:hypothetical protein